VAEKRIYTFMTGALYTAALALVLRKNISLHTIEFKANRLQQKGNVVQVPHE
jgi:hypothetical protein